MHKNGFDMLLKKQNSLLLMLIPAVVTDSLMFLICPHSVHVLNRFCKAGLGDRALGIKRR